MAAPAPRTSNGQGANRRPDPAPYRTNDYAPVFAGIAAWVIALIVLLARHHDMASRGQGWWLWVAVVGVALGFWGLALVAINHWAVARRADRARPSDDG